MPGNSPRILLLLALASSTVAIDWVDTNYIVQQAKSRASTKDAQTTIMNSATSSAKKGPWSVTDHETAVAPNGDTHAYFSFAPYHWPECSWCSKGGGTMHMVHNKTEDSGPSGGSESGDDDGSDSDEDDGNYEDETVQVEEAAEFPFFDHGMSRRDPDVGFDVPGPQLNLSSPVPIPPLPLSPTTTRTDEVAGTASHPQAAAKTASKVKDKNPPSKTSCTPSPTKSLAPTATWTLCPYKVRDGQVNPDVRTLNDPSAINGVTQSGILNAVAAAMSSGAKRTGGDSFSKNVATSIETFFLAPETKMSPNMEFGQIVRGPETGKQGTFTGILDLRGIICIVNAIEIIQKIGSDWTKERATGMASWMRDYSDWLINSSLGKSTASKANNHVTFYTVQRAAVRMALGDKTGAIEAVSGYFDDEFKDQISASGESPFEAVRTRPFHYRCFNLEAMITLAKIGDTLGQNYWSVQSKYGATIQTAVDFTMGVNPKNEDVTELAPHVAAIAAVYGDPKGKYAAFLKKTMPRYMEQAWWLYNQPEAFTQAPGNQKGKREDDAQNGVEVPEKFNCEFDLARYLDPEGRILLDDDVFTDCGELTPLYTMADSTPLVAGR
ncbi:chondroitin AC/alginate lyase [Mycena metata]|uniref:Chondroitin AC/alginate lyase n=1 Tax=Mycena metata TaxID=1033252 RepID=A0AAD7KJ87_9AGAR|nr:chondroitin AC/alginate lyase [Mycena metata]